MGYRKASDGGVFRKEDGSWFVGYSTKYRAVTPPAAELYASRKDLIMAKDLKFDRLELETDSKSLKFMLNSANSHPHHELAAIIIDVAHLLESKSRIVVMHILRASNKLAHALASFAHKMDVAHKTYFVISRATRDGYEIDLTLANSSE